jgi:hypothetical protein
MKFWELHVRGADGRWVTYLCRDRNHCDEQWEREVKLRGDEGLYGAIGYRERAEMDGVDQFTMTSSISTRGFAGF